MRTKPLDVLFEALTFFADDLLESLLMNARFGDGLFMQQKHVPFRQRADGKLAEIRMANLSHDEHVERESQEARYSRRHDDPTSGQSED